METKIKNLEQNIIDKDKFNEYKTVGDELVGNKAKGRISKRVFQESRARQNFRKTNISYPLIRTRTCACKSEVNPIGINTAKSLLNIF